jgi:hypothetical protein
MLDNLLFLLSYIKDNFSFIIILKFFWLVFLLNRLYVLSLFVLKNLYFRDSLNIYSNYYLVLPRFIILNFSLISLSHGFSLISGGLAGSNYCFVHEFIVIFLFLFNILMLRYLYKKVTLKNFIIILSFILLFLLFFYTCFTFEFIYGTNPFFHIITPIIDLNYSGMGFYEKYDAFHKSYFEEVNFNKKHPGVLPKFM